MAIEIYDKAKIVKKDGRYYYLVKHGSKNSFTLAGQYRTNDTFHRQYLQRTARDSDWKVIAHGGQEAHDSAKLAKTYWNSPTSEVYGQIRFGNGLNIALALLKGKVLDYETLDEMQKDQIDTKLEWTLGEGAKYTINLDEPIPEHKQSKEIYEYCGTETKLFPDNCKVYRGNYYWKLDNL